MVNIKPWIRNVNCHQKHKQAPMWRQGHIIIIIWLVYKPNISNLKICKQVPNDIINHFKTFDLMLFSVKLTQSNYQSMDKFVVFLVILEVQPGCTIRIHIKTQQCQRYLTSGKVLSELKTILCLKWV